MSNGLRSGTQGVEPDDRRPTLHRRENGGGGVRSTVERLEKRIQELEAQLNGAEGERLGVAQEHNRELRQLSRRLVEALENERRTMARELHDEAGQSLTALKLGLAQVVRQPGCTPELKAAIDELRSTADLALDGLHRLALDLRPPSLDRYGLLPALEQWLHAFERQCGFHVKLLARGLDGDRLPEDLETALYRIIQEALTNVARHAHATQTGMVLERRKGRVKLIVEDNGIGFDVDAAVRSGRLGLIGMHERAAMLGGELFIESRPGKGTTVYLELPSFAEEPAVADSRRRPPDPGAGPSAGPVANGQFAEGTKAPPDAEEHWFDAEAAAELSRAKALSDALLDIIETIVVGVGSDASLEQALALTAQAIGCESASIVVRDGDTWAVRYGYGMPAGMREAPWSDDELPSAAWVALHRQVLAVDERDDPPVRAEVLPHGINSHAAIPLTAGDQLLGVLTLNRHIDPTPWQPSEVAFMRRLAGTVSLALHNARLHDVTVRQRDDLAQRVEELRSLVDMLPAGIAIAHDAAAQYMSGNAFFARMLNLAPGSNVSLTAPPDERPTSFVALRDGLELPAEELPMQVAAREGREVHDQVVHLRRADGRDIVLLGSAIPLFDAAGKLRGSIGVFFDIVERQTAEARREQLRAELERRVEERTVQLAGANLRLEEQAAALAEQAGLLDLTHDAILVHDLDGRILFWNRGAEECYGWTREEAQGQKAVDLLRTELPVRADAIMTCLLGEGRWEGEMVHTRRDGSRLTVASRCVLRRNVAGAPAAVLEIHSDITERKEAEEALRQSRGDLEALARQLVEVQEQERQELAHGLHDDAGQILASLSIGLKLLEKRYGASDTARAHIAYLQDMADEVQSNIHRLGAGLRPVSLDKLGLLPALRQYAEQFAAEHHIRVTVEEVGSPGTRMPGAVEITLYRIVRKALANITSRGRVSRVEVVIQRRPDRVVAIVEDDGDAVTSDEARRHERMGVLSMRQRAEMLGGTLSVESGPITGTAVYVEVPVSLRPA